MIDPVRAWSERVRIPTYGIGPPSKHPMFLEHRVYQGSSGAVYPYPVIDRVDHEVHDQEWTALYLENTWIKIMILPELGGRLQMALDKTNDYHFVYYNRVIKPALVGLCGPWISGGIEFNWPQHHRPSTYLPVDWSIDRASDGSVTVWCSEIERMYRMRGTHGFRLRPDRACLEIDVRLYNGTREPQTFLWWANPAVHVNDEYQSVFPPDVHAVMDHGKRDVSDFPIATGTYYKMDYAPGTDISRYRNIPVPTSYMAYHSDFDFLGCYDHDKQAGMLHVADHHLVPGKKQWTWGHGDFGRAWDRQLTDEDGPYIELMCGAFTDNQPDFSWLMPGEEKAFKQVFLPYKGIGPATNATQDIVVNLECDGAEARLGVYAVTSGTYQVSLWHDTSERTVLHNHKGMRIPSVHRPPAADARRLFHTEIDLMPGDAWTDTVSLPDSVAPTELTLRVVQGDLEQIAYTPYPDERSPLPEPASAARDPESIESVEELFLNGQHLEQYRHATYAPEPYYEEALRRDPGDSRCNNAMGLLLLRRGKCTDAEAFFRKAVERLILRNPNPCDGEPFYNLGLSLTMQGRFEEAEDAFYKAVWNEAWKAPANFELARLAARRGDMEEALDRVDQSLRRNSGHQKARHLRVALLRSLGRVDEAREEVRMALEADPLDPAMRAEARFLSVNRADQQQECPRDGDHAMEVGLDCLHAGLYAEAASLFEPACNTEPAAHYFLGWTAALRGDETAAREQFGRMPHTSDHFFPNQVECVPALETAMRINPSDAVAAFGLGNFWYAHCRYEEAIACWERAVDSEPGFSTAWRNLGLAYMNKRNDPGRAQRALETSYDLDPSDARVLFELDQFYKKTNRDPSERLAFLDAHIDQVQERDDLAVEYATLLNLVGRYEDALALLSRRLFHPWEGGEGKAPGQYVRALVESAKRDLRSNAFSRAIEKLDQARRFPPNLAEGKLPGARENDVDYWLGCSAEALGQSQQSAAAFTRAAEGEAEPQAAMFYSDQPPEMIFYQGLALARLGRRAEARTLFDRLEDYGRTHLDDEIKMDYFAVSLPTFLVFEDDLTLRNRVHCMYMMALGRYGRDDLEEALQLAEDVLALQADHQGAHTLRQDIHADRSTP